MAVIRHDESNTVRRNKVEELDVLMRWNGMVRAELLWIWCRLINFLVVVDCFCFAIIQPNNAGNFYFPRVT